jgi:hypothetical protein
MLKNQNLSFQSTLHVKSFSEILIKFVKNVEIDDLENFTKFLVEKIYKGENQFEIQEKNEENFNGIVKICIRELKKLLNNKKASKVRKSSKNGKFAKVEKNSKLKNETNTQNSLSEILNILNFLSSLFDNGAMKIIEVDEIFTFLVNENLEVLKLFLQIFKAKLKPENFEHYFDVIESKMRLCNKNNKNVLKVYENILRIRERDEKIVFNIKNSENCENSKIKVKVESFESIKEVQNFVNFIVKFYNEKLLKC